MKYEYKNVQAQTKGYKEPKKENKIFVTADAFCHRRRFS
jgi:hypothetical protein